MIIPGTIVIIPGTIVIIPGTIVIIPGTIVIIPGTIVIIPSTRAIITPYDRGLFFARMMNSGPGPSYRRQASTSARVNPERTMRTKKTTTPTTLVGLSQAALRHLVKPRPDFDRFATDLLALYEAHLDVLGDAGIDVAAVKAALAEYNALRTSEMTAKAQYDLVRETRLERSSTVWVAMLEIYARATAASRTSPIIQRGIAAFAAFMKNGPRKKAAAAPATA